MVGEPANSKPAHNRSTAHIKQATGSRSNRCRAFSVFILSVPVIIGPGKSSSDEHVRNILSSRHWDIGN